MIGSLKSNSGLQTNLISKTNEIKKDPVVNSAEKNDRVASIAAAIADGSYKLDMSKTARAIAQTLI